MKSLSKASSVLGLVSLSEMVMRFVRTKCIALMLGTAGTGFLAQLVLFFETLRIWGDLGARNAIVKQVAECRQPDSEPDAYRRVVSAGFFVVVTASLTLMAAVLIFAERISTATYGDAKYAIYIRLMGLLLPLASLTTLMVSIIRGNLDFRPYVKYTISAYALVILCTPVLIMAYGIRGAVAVQALFFVAPFLAYLIFNSKRKFLLFTRQLRPRHIQELLSFGIISLYSISMYSLSRLWIATWVTKELGLDQMGLWQVVVTFSTVYLTIPVQSIQGYSLPLLAAATDNRQLEKVVNDTMRYVLFVLSPVIALLMAWPELLIDLMFSSDFRAAALPLQIQLVGTFLNLIHTCFNSCFTARGRLKVLLVINTTTPILVVSLSRFALGPWGLAGVSAAFAFAGLVITALHQVFIRRYFQFRYYPKNLKLIAASAVWLGLCMAAGMCESPIWVRMLAISLAIPWFLLSSKDHERNYIVTAVRKFTARKG